MPGFSRRAFFAGAATLMGAFSRPCRGEGQTTRTRLILLGTGGGPRPRKASSASAQVIVRNNAAYVIDCGSGVARQLVFADVPLPTLRHVFVTHHHSDHNADYGNLIWLAWTAGLRTRVDTWGPPPLTKMTRLFFEMNTSDIQTRIADEGRVPLVPLVHVHEIREGGLVVRDDQITVRATRVNHPRVVSAFAYRFDADDRSIVISGDTARSANLVKLAEGADVLVHSAVYLPAVGRLVARVPNATALKRSIIEGQTTRTRLILLGTGGGPRPRKASSASAQVIIRNNAAYVIDCGNGVARQLVFADVPLPTLRHIFLTHHHSDHNADYGNLIWLAWAAGLRTRVDTWGPPPLATMTKLFFSRRRRTRGRGGGRQDTSAFSPCTCGRSGGHRANVDRRGAHPLPWLGDCGQRPA